MVQKLLLAGMLSGFIVALFAFSFARVYCEPTIERAIALEESISHEHTDDKESVSRSVQRNAGLFVGLASYCVAMGGFLAIGLAWLHGRLGSKSRRTAWMLAATAYVSLVLVPQLKYPASPPGVGSAETIGSRTELYFLLILASAVSMLVSVWLVFRLKGRVGAAAVAIGTLLYVALAALFMALLPAVSETPHDFPRGLLFEFRVHAALLQVIIWGGLGTVFGLLAAYVVDGNRSKSDAMQRISNT